MILDEIITYKKEELDHFKRRHPLEDLKAQSRDLAKTLPFSHALKVCQENFAIIAEIKRRSPSKGLLRENFDPEVHARDYEENGAAAISVLTDEHFFGGHLDHLKKVRRAVKLPLLRKDFIWDLYQVYAARVAGADAILLIAALLEKNQIEDLQGLAHEMGMSALVEVHDKMECEKALASGAKLVGVNHRDLQTFKVDIDLSERLFPTFREGVLKISESGIDSTQTLRKLKKAGADAFLIGETFMRAEKPGEALKKLLM